MITESFALLRFEWVMALLIFILFVLNLSDVDKKPKLFLNIVNILLAVNFVVGLLPLGEGVLFQNFFRTTHLIVLQKSVINFGLLLISLSSRQWISNSQKGAEFYILMMSSALGIDVMLSSGHVLMLFVGLELSSLPLTALSAFNTNVQKSSEAGIKYILSSAFSTGMTLFGISLLYGCVGDLSFAYVMQNLHPSMLSVVAFVFILAGFAFKMSIVPFHLWAADVYEGSPTPVTNYLAVISKASVAFIMLTVLYVLFGTLHVVWMYAIGILSALSMTIGNLFAMRQQNIKRFLAFSSITQMGFVLVGISGASKIAVDSVFYFIVVYLVSNVAMFAIAEAISAQTGKEDINSYKGLYKSNPFLAIAFTVSLFSLAGVPPTAGFFGKFFLLSSGMGAGAFVLLAIAGANLIFSLYNYLRVVKAMFIDEAEDVLPRIAKDYSRDAVLVFCMLAVVALAFAGDLFRLVDGFSFIH
jgi:NADH-quinone oxidoreductase subunit N